MTAEELYYKGQEYLYRALNKTQYTGVHSCDIRDYVYKNYTLPAAEHGFAPAIMDVAKKYIEDRNYIDAGFWIREYKTITQCSRIDLCFIFGASTIAKIFPFIL